ncbi:hypothetical protein HCN44_001268 [Aphidius gifuensis]|uniref:non-specific serine/threonine protein kinase n=1 Tax=Aphidius gifuensis TaxID=684658 RepID=A0A834XKP9_APHGI|nr:hypothetical protein HCN44_001268 [Aphidius gifuensis]
MASSPRIIISKFGQQKLSPRPTKNSLNISKSLSPKTPTKSPHRLSLSFNIDTPNKSKILNNQLLSPREKYNKENCVVGCGGFGTVYRASYHGNPVAVKIIKRKIDNDTSVESEKNAKLLQHSNIVKVYEIDQGINCSIITMELCGKTLQDKLDESILNKIERIDTWCTITIALEFCHNAGIIHADIKPKNILISADGNIKLADFGNSISTNDIAINKSSGTPGYVAPEVIKGKQPTKSSDIYSLGILAWQLLTRKIPFDGMHAHTILYLSGKGNRPNDEHVDDEFNGEYKNLYRQMWSDDENKRPLINIIIIKLKELLKNT